MYSYIFQVQSSNLNSAYPGSKLNGGIPIIVTPANDSTEESHNLSYDPEDSVYGQDEDSKAAKSLEEQVIDLEKEYDRITEAHNHVGEQIEATTAGKTESQKEAKEAPKKGGCSCVKLMGVTFFSVFLTLTVAVCVVMFSDIQHPVMNDLRTHLHFLEPTRDYIRDTYNSMF